MLFNSWQFALFFPVVTAVYFMLPHAWRWAWLLAMSCLFYMAFIPAYILILLFTIGLDYALGLLIDRADGPWRKIWLASSVCANVAVLAFFKYFNFLNENIRGLAGLLHWNYPIEALSILLPIGLSFHTFQSLAYVIEVYRGRQQPERHLGIYALYVMFYPQLVAGPIERPQNLLHQFRERHRFDYDRVTSGLKLMLGGLLIKVVIADRLATIANPVFDHPTAFTGLPLIVGTLAFSFQIFCDFAGYSTIAIGAARVMGFTLMQNFNRPYFSRSVSEFWTRWHISLSTWFKDYLYIPLGGNRVGKWRWRFNMMAVFMVSGLWHGASWTFVVWGALHAGYVILADMTQSLREKLYAVIGLDRAPQLKSALHMAATFTFVSVAWIYFRAQSLTDAWHILTHLTVGLQPQLAGLGALAATLRLLDVPLREMVIATVSVAALLACQALQSKHSLQGLLARRSRLSRVLVYQTLILALIFLGAYEQKSFIYFQF